MVKAVRRGKAIRAVARQFRVSPPTVQRWVEKVKGQRLDRCSFSDASPVPKKVANRTAPEIEQMILEIRKSLKEDSPLGEFGALAILGELKTRKPAVLPSLRTIGRILQRGGALDYQRRVRRQPPRLGWYLDALANGSAELDEFDFVSGLVLGGGVEVEVLNVVSLRGSLVGSFVASSYNTESAIVAILEHWREVGLPDYAQFDNDTRFQGPHQYPDAIGRIIGLCLSLAVTPIFAPPRELGFQNSIESYNGLWQAKVWARFEHTAMAGLQEQSRKYVFASRQRKAARIASAPRRRVFPKAWKRHHQSGVRGRIIYLRRSDEQGAVQVLGRRYQVSSNWQHRLVRCEVDIDQKEMRFYALRRSAADKQPLLRRTPYELPRRYRED